MKINPINTNFFTLPENNIKHSNPNFWQDLMCDVPIIKILKDNFDQVKKEILNYVDNEIMYDYPKEYTKELYKNEWKSIAMSKSMSMKRNSLHLDHYGITQEALQNFLKIGKGMHRARELCPTIDNIMNKFEHDEILTNSFISKVSKGTVINPHQDLYIDLIRTQLGIQCDPMCKITVGNETQSWKEGEFLAFKTDGPLHSVNHNGEVDRIIFSFDLKLEYVKEFIQ